jgi:hypothetical protein
MIENKKLSYIKVSIGSYLIIEWIYPSIIYQLTIPIYHHQLDTWPGGTMASSQRETRGEGLDPLVYQSIMDFSTPNYW